MAQRETKLGSDPIGHEKLRAVAEKLEDLEALVLARQRMRALQNGEDRLIPLDEVMGEFDKPS